MPAQAGGEFRRALHLWVDHQQIERELELAQQAFSFRNGVCGNNGIPERLQRFRQPELKSEIIIQDEKFHKRLRLPIGQQELCQRVRRTRGGRMKIDGNLARESCSLKFDLRLGE